MRNAQFIMLNERMQGITLFAIYSTLVEIAYSFFVLINDITTLDVSITSMTVSDI
jgi:hypothetical protein